MWLEGEYLATTAARPDSKGADERADVGNHHILTSRDVLPDPVLVIAQSERGFMDLVVNDPVHPVAASLGMRNVLAARLCHGSQFDWHTLELRPVTTPHLIPVASQNGDQAGITFDEQTLVAAQPHDSPSALCCTCSITNRTAREQLHWTPIVANPRVDVTTWNGRIVGHRHRSPSTQDHRRGFSYVMGRRLRSTVRPEVPTVSAGEQS